MTYHDFVEAWITELDGTLVGYLERSPSSLIRGVTWSIERNKPGAAAFEYHRSSPAIIANPALVNLDQLLWIRYRDVTKAFVLEQRTMQFDEKEGATGWYKVAGRGALALLGDRLVWPDGFDGTNQPTDWGDQYHTAAGVHAGDMLWTLIQDTEPRFAALITAGTIETTAGDEWTQQFRFDTILDVVDSVTKALGDVEMNGLEFSYYNDIGTDRSASIFMEQGIDHERAARDTTAQEYSWLVAEGVGEGVFAKIATDSGGTSPRRREGYLDAKDIESPDMLALVVAGELDTYVGRTDRLSFDMIEEADGGRYAMLRDFGVGDYITTIAPDLGLSESVRVVAMYFAEQDERVIPSFDVNDQRTEHLLALQEGNESSARSIGRRNRMPQGQLVPYALGPWSGPFDTDVAAEFYFQLPSRMFLTLEAIVNVRLRAFQATSRAANGSTSGPSSANTTVAGGGQTPTSSSGGGQTPTSTAGGSQTPTSGASSSATTGGGGHQHVWGSIAVSAAYTPRSYVDGAGSVYFQLATDVAQGLATAQDFPVHTHGMTHTHDVTIASHTHDVTIAAHSHTVTISAHDHGMAHTHSVPQLDLIFGMYQEAMPGSWSVTPKLYSVDSGGGLTLAHTFGAITGEVEQIDMTQYIDAPGGWMLRLQSDAGEPQGGRLVADIYGSIVGAIQSTN